MKVGLADPPVHIHYTSIQPMRLYSQSRVHFDTSCTASSVTQVGGAAAYGGSLAGGGGGGAAFRPSPRHCPLPTAPACANVMRIQMGGGRATPVPTPMPITFAEHWVRETVTEAVAGPSTAVCPGRRCGLLPPLWGASVFPDCRAGAQRERARHGPCTHGTSLEPLVPIADRQSGGGGGGGDCGQGASNPIANNCVKIAGKLRQNCGAATKPPEASRSNTSAQGTRRAPTRTRGGHAKSNWAKKLREIAENC